MPEPVDVGTIVRSRLEAARLPVSDEEFAVFVRMYARVQEAAESLYIPETRYEEPNMVFSLVPYLKPAVQEAGR